MLIEIIEVEVGHLAKGSTRLPCSPHPADYSAMSSFLYVGNQLHLTPQWSPHSNKEVHAIKAKQISVI